MTRPLALAVAALLAAAPAAPAAAATTEPDDGGPGGLDYPRGGEGPEGSEVAFTLQDPRITESSGIAPSRLHEGVWWTHNDSGPIEPEVYAVDDSGATLATITLAVRLRDWEAITVTEGADGTPWVLVGDIGDNFGGGWPDVSVYRFPEPGTLADATVEPEEITLSYADGGRDAESMMVDPRDGRLYVVSKEFAAGVYAAPEELDPAGENTLERIDSAPLYPTDAAFSPDGERYVIRTYWSAYVYDAADGVPGASLGSFELPESTQGESIAFTPDGTALMAGTEGVGAPVWRVPLPDRYLSGEPDRPDGPSGADAEPTETESAADTDSDRTGAAPFILGGVGVAALLIGGIVLLARRG
ncbi:hypothetical protein [Nocardiopsis sp. FIRDI 009]|uniref:hypothetical protein n=1 Tax=Nocardiopsis sp. FIRDI 009 TaxID=714197 RepID=UPI000E2614D0|nr:hypothetical protein [Nocardiopsis sp. FIRDI 009]